MEAGWVVSDVPPGLDRERWVPVLELADEPVPLRACLQGGSMLAVEDAAGAPVAAILVRDADPGVAELRAVAVSERHQGRGLGTELVSLALFHLARDGYTTAVVGTASSGVRQLGFYQRCGFRLSHVERDFFTAERGYPPGLAENGIATRDIVWMDRDLTGLLRG